MPHFLLKISTFVGVQFSRIWQLKIEWSLTRFSLKPNQIKKEKKTYGFSYLSFKIKIVKFFCVQIVL